MFTLLTGGARSGKSTAAQRLAERFGADVTFIATATAEDEEMAARITLHRQERPAEWGLVEEPLALATSVAGADPRQALIIDCLGLWVTNQLDADDEHIWEQADETAKLLARRPGSSIVVTNEVGSGIVPGNELSRRFRDLLGGVNQRFAQHADQTLLCIAGGVVSVQRLEDIR